MNKFDTHKFLFSLYYEGKIKGHKILYVNKNNEDTLVKITKIEIGASTVSCKVYDEDNTRITIPYIRIKKVFFEDVMVWENTDFNIDDAKIIKGYK